MIKQICVLTKSLKDRNYCVAGIELSTGKWIRLVTSKDGDAFPKNLLDDQKVKEFTLIDVAVTKHVPCGIQTENWQIDEDESLDKVKFTSATLIISIPAHPFGENELYYKFVAKVII